MMNDTKFAKEYRDLLAKSNIAEFPGQTLIAAAGHAEDRIDANSAAAELALRAGKASGPNPVNWDQELRDAHVVRTYEDKRRGITGSMVHRSKDMTWPK